MKDLMALYITNFYKMYVQNLKYNIKGTYFSFGFGWYSVHFDILIFSIKNRRGARGDLILFNGQNPLSEMKVICWQSLTTNFDTFKCSGENLPNLFHVISKPQVSFSSNFT